MSDTPLTDDSVLIWSLDPKVGFDGNSIQGRVVKADFARQLERDLNATRARLAELEEIASALAKTLKDEVDINGFFYFDEAKRRLTDYEQWTQNK